MRSCFRRYDLRKAVLAVVSVLICTSLGASSFVPVKSVVPDDVFLSPALLAREEKSGGFGFEISSYADIDALNFISDPGYTLSGAAAFLRDELLAEEDAYFSDNYDSIKEIFRFDPRFPNKHSDVAENAYYIRNYLNTRYEEMGAGNRVKAVSNALSSQLGIFPDDTSALVGGDLDFTLSVHGSGIDSGFGWKAGMDVIYDGASSLLDSFSYNDYRYGSNLYFLLGASLGYGTYITDNLAAGLSVSPSFIFRTTTVNTSLLSARISGNALEFLASNRFDFGVLLDINFSLMLDAGENAVIHLDFRSLPSMQMFWYFSASDVMDDFRFHEDETIYYSVPDVALGMIWEKGSVRIEAGLSRIAKQFLLMSAFTSYSFDLLSVPDLLFAWSITDNLTLDTGYDDRTVHLGCSVSSFRAELSTRIDRPGFGISLGCEF